MSNKGSRARSKKTETETREARRMASGNQPCERHVDINSSPEEKRNQRRNELIAWLHSDPSRRVEKGRAMKKRDCSGSLVNVDVVTFPVLP